MCGFEMTGNKETDDDDDDVYEEGLETKNKIEKSVEKGLGRNIQFLGIGAVLRDVSPAFALEGGGCDVDADADRYTDSFALVYPLQLVSFSPRPGFEARATERQVWPALVDALSRFVKGRPDDWFRVSEKARLLVQLYAVCNTNTLSVGSGRDKRN